MDQNNPNVGSHGEIKPDLPIRDISVTQNEPQAPLNGTAPQSQEVKPIVPLKQPVANPVETPAQISRELTVGQNAQESLPSTTLQKPVVPSQGRGVPNVQPQGSLDYSQKSVTNPPAEASSPEILANLLPQEPDSQTAFKTVAALTKLKNSQHQSGSHSH